MAALSEIEIRAEGSVGAQKLMPALVDIEKIREILARAAGLLFPLEKLLQRSQVGDAIVESSVRHKLPPVLQSVIGFGAFLTQISSQGQIDLLHERSAVAIENLKHLAVESTYVITSSAYDDRLKMGRTTRYLYTAKLWVDAEFYLYGGLANAGRDRSQDIHLDTEGFGTLRISMDKNLLYKMCELWITSKQNLQTFEMDCISLTFVDLFHYDMEYSGSYLDGLMKNATPAWESLPNADEWVDEIRGRANIQRAWKTRCSQRHGYFETIESTTDTMRAKCRTHTKIVKEAAN